MTDDQKLRIECAIVRLQQIQTDPDMASELASRAEADLRVVLESIPPFERPLSGANDGMSGAAHEWEKNQDANWGSH